MIATFEEIAGAALALPPGARAILAEQLLGSLDEPEQQVDQLWAEEAERRLTEIETGQVSTISSEQVFAKLRARKR